MKIKATAPAMQSKIDEASRPGLIIVSVRFDTSFMFSSENVRVAGIVH